MRGRRPTKGLENALEIAKDRGDVMKLCEDSDRVVDFIILSPGRLIFVRVVRVTRLRCSPEDLDAECETTIRVLRTVPGYGPVVRELWAYSRHGIRFFRIGDETIERIDKNGNFAAEPQRIPHAPQATARTNAAPDPATPPAMATETRPVNPEPKSAAEGEVSAFPPYLPAQDSPGAGTVPGGLRKDGGK